MNDRVGGVPMEQLLRYAQDVRQAQEERDREHRARTVAESALEGTRSQLLITIQDMRHLFESERDARTQIRDAYSATIRALASAIEARDDYTGKHVERVHHNSMAIAKHLDLDQEALARLDAGSILHDVGKIAVPDAVVTKPGPLDAEEWRLMKLHPLRGVEILRGIRFLEGALEVIATHHERWDGGGYPRGLTGTAIPLTGRIVAVADTFDALTTDRVYRGHRTITAALAEIQRCSRTQFDPAVVEAFLRVWKERSFP